MRCLRRHAATKDPAMAMRLGFVFVQADPGHFGVGVGRMTP
jgi:hypothetical protein